MDVSVTEKHKQIYKHNINYTTQKHTHTFSFKKTHEKLKNFMAADKVISREHEWESKPLYK